MCRVLSSVGVSILIALACSHAWSQTNPGGGQTSNDSSPASQQPTPEPAAAGGQAQPSVQVDVRAPGRRTSGYGGINQRPWFENRAVREQLRLNENQFNRLNQAYQRAWRQYNQNVTGLGEGLSAEARQERMQALRNDFDRDFSQARSTVFNDPQIRDRYNQLNYQYRGYEAFQEPDLQQRLNMTPEQRQQIGQLRDEWNAEMGDVEQLYSTDPDAAADRYRQLQMQSQERLGTFLTPEQQRRWSETIGDRFDFPADTYFDSDRTARRPISRLPERNRR